MVKHNKYLDYSRGIILWRHKLVFIPLHAHFGDQPPTAELIGEILSERGEPSAC